MAATARPRQLSKQVPPRWLQELVALDDPKRLPGVHRNSRDNVNLAGGGASMMRLLPAGAVAGGTCTHWRAPPYHGAHPERTPACRPLINLVSDCEQHSTVAREMAAHSIAAFLMHEICDL